MSDLVERLRALVTVDKGGKLSKRRRNPDGPEAADRIATLEARVEMLQGALAPFAKIASVDIGEDEHDSDLVRPTRHNLAPNINVGMLRAARAALAPEPSE